MKIFKIKDPYFALIAAHDEFEVTDTYKKIVADVEDEEFFIAGLKIIDNQEAAARVSKATSEETGKPLGMTEGMQEVMNAINNNEPYLLLMDGSLA